jgi:hypothetical protein
MDLVDLKEAGDLDPPIGATVEGYAGLVSAFGDQKCLPTGTCLESGKELEPSTRMTINDHILKEHPQWSDPQQAVIVERAIDHIFLFRF